MTLGDLAENPMSIVQAKHGLAAIEVGEVRWRKHLYRDNKSVRWERVKRYSPPTDPITLERGMMFSYMGLID